MNKNILVATFSALALNATYAEDIYLQDIEWNNTTVTYNADECLTAKSGLSGIPSYGGATFYSYNFDNPESPLNVSGNSTITINPENIDTTQYENIQISIMLNYTTINFDLSTAKQDSPMLNFDLTSLLNSHDWVAPNVSIILSNTVFELSGVEGLAAGKYCLFNVEGATEVLDDGGNSGIGGDSKVSYEKTATGYAIYYDNGQVPEPTTGTLSLLGLATLMMRRRRA